MNGHSTVIVGEVQGSDAVDQREGLGWLGFVYHKVKVLEVVKGDLWTGGPTIREANITYEMHRATDPNRPYWTNTTCHFAATLNFAIGQSWFPQCVIPAFKWRERR